MKPSSLIGAFVTTAPSGAAGEFADFQTGPDGIGRLVDIMGREASVEYFVSPAGPHLVRKRIDLALLKRVRLMLETVIFSQDLTSSKWRRGRIIASEQANVAPAEERYRVKFPNDNVQLLTASELHVRWAHSIDDPLEYVIARVTDTPFYFEGRRSIVRNLANQRALFGGMTGLASSAIDLLAHQIATVRRILADPVERYLLADEVGLGKTIEAGIIIRQHLLDCPAAAHVLVVVPPHLVAQWRLELETKFGIDSGDQRVIVAADEAVAEDSRGSPWTMLVVDEAHRAAPGAFAGGNSIHSRLYRRLEELAKATPRVLLLSGTPVLRQEDGFLAMLHLLDPEAYRLTDREAFRQRIAARSDVANAAAELTDGAPGLFLERAVRRLQGTFGADSRLSALATEVLRLAEDETSQERNDAIRALRLHVTEAYKLHRRLLRTRRDDPAVRDLLGRRSGIELLDCQDEPRALAWELVEGWRTALPLDEMGARPAQGQDHLSLLVEAGLSHPLAVQGWFQQRGESLRSRTGRAKELFEGEGPWCETAARKLEAVVREEPRAQHLAAWIEDDGGKVIVFVDRADVATRVCEVLRERLGSALVVDLRNGALPSPGPMAPVEAFIRNAAVRVLVADRQSEEGLNLQRVHATLVHYDLPLAPTRIEQRNGRVDRLEAKRAPKFVTFAGASEYETAWVEYLRDTVCVFSRSVAPLQYALADSCVRLGRGFLDLGAEAFVEESRRLTSVDSLEGELAAIRQQEALDSIGLDAAEEADFYEAMVAGDDLASEAAGADCDAWLSTCLKFQRKACGSEGVAGTSLQYAYPLAKQPLLPLHEVVTAFASSIDRTRPSKGELLLGPLSYDRLDATTFKGVQLLRPGSPFLSAVEELVRRDDRGAAFAMWRQVPGKAHDEASLYFRFDFVVEADMAAAEAAVRQAGGATEALRRIADSALPPAWRTIWIDADLKQVTDPEVMAILERRFDKTTDKNLRLERWDQVDQHCPVHDWPGLCAKAHAAARKALLTNVDFLYCRDLASRRFKEASEGNRVQAETRVALLTDGSTRTAEVRAASEALRLDELILNGIRSPKATVDSMGAMYLAGTHLVSRPA